MPTGVYVHKSGPVVEKVCAGCGVTFSGPPAWIASRKYHSFECYAANGEHPRGPKKAQWQGGTYIHDDGKRKRRMILDPGNPRAKRGYVDESILIVEKVLGHALPAKAVVHHINRDSLDNRNDNFVVCNDQAHQVLIHARQRIVEAGGNPDEDKICGQCGKVKPKEEFYVSRKCWNGRMWRCKECHDTTPKKFRRRDGSIGYTSRPVDN